VTTLGMTKEDMKEIASIINLVLQGTKPGLTKEGKPAKGKIEIDSAVEEEGKKRVNALLSKYVLYPELDLDFLKAEFVKD
ncbi:MAG: glycine hydroxymethyltransferase, partial [Treponema sp.]|nr:glycine hydroxymethyltransferase [Treponema sp.]